MAATHSATQLLLQVCQSSFQVSMFHEHTSSQAVPDSTAEVVLSCAVIMHNIKEQTERSPAIPAVTKTFYHAKNAATVRNVWVKVSTCSQMLNYLGTDLAQTFYISNEKSTINIKMVTESPERGLRHQEEFVD